MNDRSHYIAHLLAVIDKKDEEIAELRELLSRKIARVAKEPAPRRVKRLGLDADLRMTVLED